MAPPQPNPNITTPEKEKPCTPAPEKEKSWNQAPPVQRPWNQTPAPQQRGEINEDYEKVKKSVVGSENSGKCIYRQTKSPSS